MADWLAEVRSIFSKAGVPEWVWLPIARQESGLDPTSHNSSGEDSRGLFQINLDAHPEYSGYNLFDPVTNARIALSDFILPAYQEVAYVKDPGEQAAYVWRYGIRPNWGSVTARGADTVIRSDARLIAGGSSPTVPDTLPNVTPAPGGGSGGGSWWGGLLPKPDKLKTPAEKAADHAAPGVLTAEFWQQAGLYILLVVILLLLFAGGFWGLAKAFGADQAIKQAVM